MGEIFANSMSDKGLISKIKNSYNSTTKQQHPHKHKQSNLRMDRVLEQTLLQKCTNGQQIYAKMLNFNSYEENYASEISQVVKDKYHVISPISGT